MSALFPVGEIKGGAHWGCWLRGWAVGDCRAMGHSVQAVYLDIPNDKLFSVNFKSYRM